MNTLYVWLEYTLASSWRTGTCCNDSCLRYRWSEEPVMLDECIHKTTIKGVNMDAFYGLSEMAQHHQICRWLTIGGDE